MLNTNIATCIYIIPTININTIYNILNDSIILIGRYEIYAAGITVYNNTFIPLPNIFSGYVEKVVSNEWVYTRAICSVSFIHTEIDLNIISVAIWNILPNVPSIRIKIYALILPLVANIPISAPYNKSPKAEKLHFEVSTF